MASKKSGGTPALRLTLGGAPNTWHMVGQHPGLWHPSIAVPVDVVEGTEDWAKPLHDDPGCPLELVFVSDDEADAAREAFANARGESLDALLTRLQRRDPHPPDVANNGVDVTNLATSALTTTATDEE